MSTKAPAIKRSLPVEIWANDGLIFIAFGAAMAVTVLVAILAAAAVSRLGGAPLRHRAWSRVASYAAWS